MRLTVIGSGYVGRACMAETGNHVVRVDVDADDIVRPNNGDNPIYKPGLGACVERTVEAGQ